MNDKQRRAAVDQVTALVESGLSVNKATKQIAESIGVHQNTVKSWAKRFDTSFGAVASQVANNARDAAREQHEARRAQVSLMLLDDFLWVRDRMRTEDKARDIQALTTAAAILVDKMRLEEGKSTSRQSVTVEQALSVVDAEIERLTEEMNAR